jgi:hypothetical protein
MPPKPAAAKDSLKSGKKPAVRLADDAEDDAGGSSALADVTAMLKVKDLVDSVAEATGSKKPEVRKTVEATLAALAGGFAAGRAMNFPQLGKLRVVKNNGTVLTLKLRLADAPKAAGLALADDGEDD